MFLLDTNVVSELRPGKAMPSAAVRMWAEHAPSEHMYLSAATIMELEIGLLLMERRDPGQAKRMRVWFRDIVTRFASRTLPFTGATAMWCAPMHVPNRRSDRDAMIAATAKEHGYTVVTRNIRDFQECGVAVLNPWETPGPN